MISIDLRAEVVVDELLVGGSKSEAQGEGIEGQDSHRRRRKREKKKKRLYWGGAKKIKKKEEKGKPKK